MLAVSLIAVVLAFLWNSKQTAGPSTSPPESAEGGRVHVEASANIAEHDPNVARKKQETPRGKDATLRFVVGRIVSGDLGTPLPSVYLHLNRPAKTGRWTQRELTRDVASSDGEGRVRIAQRSSLVGELCHYVVTTSPKRSSTMLDRGLLAVRDGFVIRVPERVTVQGRVRWLEKDLGNKGSVTIAQPMPLGLVPQVLGQALCDDAGYFRCEIPLRQEPDAEVVIIARHDRYDHFKAYLPLARLRSLPPVVIDCATPYVAIHCSTKGRKAVSATIDLRRVDADGVPGSLRRMESGASYYLVAGHYEYIANASGHRPMYGSWWLRSSYTGNHILRVELQPYGPPRRVRVVTVDEDGKPVPNCRVRWHRKFGEFPVSQARSDAQGLLIAELDPAHAWTLQADGRAKDGGTYSSDKTHWAPRQHDECRIVLRRDSRLLVRLQTLGEMPRVPLIGWLVGKNKTHRGYNNGNLSFYGIRPGSYDVLVSSADKSLSGRSRVEIGTRTAHDVVVELARTQRHRIRITAQGCKATRATLSWVDARGRLVASLSELAPIGKDFELRGPSIAKAQLEVWIIGKGKQRFAMGKPQPVVRVLEFR